ncbi:GGDEF domain-containing protein [Novosphingobium sp.]|uniref:GGDEF domain-containing protein n=1 Tax=Novosphingobium sp. TaxID=1874826 RepID=UPI0028A8DAD3|nr:GGDEF domain-containing protein [Novosphingobium sp.]
MTFPDVDTLRLCSTLSSSAFGLVFGVLWLRDRTASHYAYWASSSLLYVAVLYAFTAVPRGEPTGLALIYAVLGLTNALPVTGALALDGALDGGRAWRRWMIVPVVGPVIGHALPGALDALGWIARPDRWQSAGDAAGLALSMGLSGLVLAFGKGAQHSAGRRLAGLAMLAYLPGYFLSIAGAFLDLPGKDVVALLALLSDQLLLGVLNLALLAIPVEQVQRRLRAAALRDPLTGCWNRAGLEQVAERFLLPGAAVIAIDVDHFKSINDRHGHAVGDGVLMALGREAKALANGEGGYAARLGGDEFLVLLPVACRDPERFMDCLRERLEASMALADFWSVSMGLAHVEADDRRIDDVIVRADRSLYEAKARRGRPVPQVC